MTAVDVPNPSNVDFFATVEQFFDEGWADGLPVVPPTENAVRRMLSTVSRAPDEVVGLVPPRMGKATVEKLAINAVMAGCRPEYFPVVLMAAEAMLDESFCLAQVQVTSWCGAPLTIVNGPIRSKLGINCATNVFGPGVRANATIGRALRLMLVNLGGAVGDSGTTTNFGHPARFSFCIGEREEASPWEPLHVERGFQLEDSCVTVITCEGPRHINGGLSRVADNMAAFDDISMVGGKEFLVVVGLQIAKALGDAGWSKRDVKEYLFQNSRFPVAKIIEAGGTVRGVGTKDDPTFRVRQSLEERFPKWANMSDPAAMAPVTPSPDQITVIVAGGGATAHCALLPGMGAHGGHLVTKRIKELR